MLYRPKNHKANMYNYKCPDGSLQRVALTIFYTTYKVPIYEYKYRPVNDVQYFNNIPVYDRVNNIPLDYTGWMYVPVTSITYLQPVEIDDNINSNIPNKYVRVCVRRK